MLILKINFAEYFRLNILVIMCLVLLIVGCSSAPTRNPLPLELTNQANIEGIPDARFWADEWPKFAVERWRRWSDQEMQQHFEGVYNTEHNYLAISGGGAHGAYGAGLLLGWSDAGTRPEFTVVTGISTGALTAPFAFLGPEYDATLKQVYTTTTTDDIYRERGILSAIFSDSLVDTSPLRELIEKYITVDIIEKIAMEYTRGRRLYIGTMNLDAGRSMIWNIGSIAGSNHPRKVALIHDILQASASIPVFFTPVAIPINVNGKQYDELHVDGGTGSQVFVYPASLDWREVTEKLKVKGKPNVYVIRNAFIQPDYRGVNREVLPIASRSISALIRTQGIGDLYQIHALCTRDGNDFNLTYIPADFDKEPKEEFDPEYMSALFELGYQRALKGYSWDKYPPGYYLFHAVE